MKKNLKKFVLVFNDNTSTITEHYELNEVKNCYLNNDVLVNYNPRVIKFCINVVELLPDDESYKAILNKWYDKDEEISELKHRLDMIKDDLSELIDFIDEERMMEAFDKPTRVSDSAWNLISNIEIACGLSNKESLSWEKFNK